MPVGHLGIGLGLAPGIADSRYLFFPSNLILRPRPKGQQLPGMSSSCWVTGPYGGVPHMQCLTASVGSTSAETHGQTRLLTMAVTVTMTVTSPWGREGYSASGGRTVNVSERI